MPVVNIGVAADLCNTGEPPTLFSCQSSHQASTCNVSALLSFTLVQTAFGACKVRQGPLLLVHPCMSSTHNTDQLACSSHAGARSLKGGNDDGGPPPIVCKKTPGPLGTNIVCN